MKLNKLKIKYQKYLNELFDGLKNINENNLTKATNLIAKTIKSKNTIFICGNGGSASISNHYICDFLKLVREYTKYKPKIISLSNSIELITAISNDFKYEDIFSYQIDTYGERNDILILISSSGNSKNIINAVKSTKKKKINTIGFCGFEGGKLKKVCNIPIHLRLNNYGQSEDAHHILMHFIMEMVIKKLGGTKDF